MPSKFTTEERRKMALAILVKQRKRPQASVSADVVEMAKTMPLSELRKFAAKPKPKSILRRPKKKKTTKPKQSAKDVQDAVSKAFQNNTPQGKDVKISLNINLDLASLKAQAETEELNND